MKELEKRSNEMLEVLNEIQEGLNKKSKMLKEMSKLTSELKFNLETYIVLMEKDNETNYKALEDITKTLEGYKKRINNLIEIRQEGVDNEEQ